jgi:hypothetical protein
MAKTAEVCTRILWKTLCNFQTSFDLLRDFQIFGGVCLTNVAGCKLLNLKHMQIELRVAPNSQQVTASSNFGEEGFAHLALSSF